MSFQRKAEEKKLEIKKYSVKPPRDLTSKFIKKQERRKIAEQEAEEEKRRVEEDVKQLVGNATFNTQHTHF